MQENLIYGIWCRSTWKHAQLSETKNKPGKLFLFLTNLFSRSRSGRWPLCPPSCWSERRGPLWLRGGRWAFTVYSNNWPIKPLYFNNWPITGDHPGHWSHCQHQRRSGLLCLQLSKGENILTFVCSFFHAWRMTYSLFVPYTNCIQTVGVCVYCTCIYVIFVMLLQINRRK